MLGRQLIQFRLFQVVDDDGDEQVYHHKGADYHETDEVYPRQRVEFHRGSQDFVPALQRDDLEQG